MEYRSAQGGQGLYGRLRLSIQEESRLPQLRVNQGTEIFNLALLDGVASIRQQREHVHCLGQHIRMRQDERRHSMLTEPFRVVAVEMTKRPLIPLSSEDNAFPLRREVLLS